MGILELDIQNVPGKYPGSSRCYDDLDHPFSAHEANPSKPETLDELRTRVVAEHADLGLRLTAMPTASDLLMKPARLFPWDHMTGIIAREVLKSPRGDHPLLISDPRGVKKSSRKRAASPKNAKSGSRQYQTANARRECRFARRTFRTLLFPRKLLCQRNRFARRAPYSLCDERNQTNRLCSQAI